MGAGAGACVCVVVVGSWGASPAPGHQGLLRSSQTTAGGGGWPGLGVGGEGNQASPSYGRIITHYGHPPG